VDINHRYNPHSNPNFWKFLEIQFGSVDATSQARRHDYESETVGPAGAC
jgi:hypothetical protein